MLPWDGENFDVFSTGVLDSPDNKPSINDDFTSIFTNPLDSRYSKAINGCTIVVLPGTYKVNDTIQIPSGTSLFGQMYNSTFVNQTSPQKPLFRIIADANRTTDLAINLDRDVIFTKETKLFNLIISDNYLLPIIGGDTTYKDAKNTTEALITIDRGANCSIDNVKFLGRTTGGTTLRAIDTTQSTGSLTGTHIKIENCYFDGFQNVMRLRSSSDVAGSRKDYFVIANNKMRAYGDGAYVDYETNSFISMNEANGTIINNYMYLNDPLMLAGIYINAFTTDTLTSSYTRMVVSGNSGVIQKAAVDINANNIPFIKFSGNGDKTSISAVGNNWGTDISSWYITIAGENSKYIGDFNGSNSLDVALSFAKATTDDSNISTIYLYPGEYLANQTITSLDQNKARLIGIRNGNQKPIIYLNTNNALAVASTSFPSRERSFLLANELRSIDFSINDSNISSPQVDYYANVIVNNGSAGFSSEAYNILIDDCTFFNVCLIVPKKESTSGNNDAGVRVTNCNFYLDGAKNHDVACILPAGLNVVVENCNFNVDSSAFLNIGYEPTDYSTLGINSNFYYNSNIKLSNNMFNLTDTSFNINDTTAVGLYFQAVANYSLINVNSASNLFIENNRFFDGQLRNRYSALVTNLINLSAYRPAHIKLQAKNLFMDQNVFACSKDSSTINIGGSDAVMPMLQLDINRSIFIDKCSFLNWKLPILTTGDSLNEVQNQEVSANFLTNKNCFNLINSEFNQSSDEYYNNQIVVFDFKDPDVNHIYNFENSFGSVIIDNCKFINYASIYDTITNAPAPITNLFGLPLITYNVGGSTEKRIIEFTSKYFDLKINNCIFDINLYRLAIDTSVIFQYYVVSFDGESGISPGKQLTEFTFTNNKISVISNLNVNASSESAILKLKEGYIKISNNLFSIYNIASPIGKLCWIITTPNSIDNSVCYINDNVFKRNSTPLSYAGIDLSDWTIPDKQFNRIYIIDNYFDDATIDGGSDYDLLIRLPVDKEFGMIIDRNVNHRLMKVISAFEFKPYGVIDAGFSTNRANVLDQSFTTGPLSTTFWSTIYDRAVSIESASTNFSSNINRGIITNGNNATVAIDEATFANSFSWIIPFELPIGASILNINISYRLTNTGASMNAKIGGLLLNSSGLVDESNQIIQVSNWVEKAIIVPATSSSFDSISVDFSLNNARIKFNKFSTYNIFDKYYILLNTNTDTPTNQIYVSYYDCLITYTY